MSTAANSSTTTDAEREVIRAWIRRIGTGWRVMSTDKRRFLAVQSAKARWELRRQRYGESGQRPLNYKRYREARGFPPIGDDGREVSPNNATNDGA